MIKIPGIFLPEKNLDEKINSMKSFKEEKLNIRSLKDLILKEGPYAKYASSSKILQATYERSYSRISKTDIIDGIYISYHNDKSSFTPCLDIFKFTDAQTLRGNIDIIVQCARNLSIDYSLKVSVIAKGRYACFVYTSEDDHEWIFDAYEKKFGFKTVEI